MNICSARERTFQNALLKLVGSPYRFGGRSRVGIDCSSLLVRAIRQALRANVALLPWMTADQLAKGLGAVTVAAESTETRCMLAFFDWDRDGIFEHAAVRLVDHTWIWASTSAGKVIHVDPAREVRWGRQWQEINSSLAGPDCVNRTVNWEFLLKQLQSAQR